MVFRFKKSSIIWMLVIAVMVTGGLFFSGMFKSRDPLTMEQMKQFAQESGYTFTDLNDLVAGDMGELCAVEFDATGNVQFSVMKSEEDAVGTYSVSYEKFQAREEDASTRVHMETDHYEKYSLTTEDEYMLCIRVKNTILYADCPVEYKDQINQFVETIGY